MTFHIPFQVASWRSMFPLRNGKVREKMELKYLHLCYVVLCVFRAKSARVITFEQFTQALVELALKRYKGKSQDEAQQLIYGLIAGKEPANVGITVRTGQS